MAERRLIDIIQDIVNRQTRYMRHYDAQVVDRNDPLGKGRVKCTIPGLGRTTSDEALWCFPRYPIRSLLVPQTDQWVEVYFMNGKIERPVYLNGVSEIKAVELNNYDGEPDTIVVMESQDGETRITWDGEIIRIESDGEAEVKVTGGDIRITADGGNIDLNGDGKTLVTFDELDTALQSFKSSIDSAIAGAITGHTHSGVTTGPGVSGPGTGSAPATSVDISSAEAASLRTDG